MQIVLDAPKAPMEPAWVSVLRISCVWARGESTQDGAARKLTIELHRRGMYAGVTFVRLLTDPDVGERFYLREYIRAGFMGQCNDFADFLVCLMTSVGIPSKVSQRTHPILASRRETNLPNGNPGRLIVFCTKPLDIAPTGSNPLGGPLDGPQLYPFHQFCLSENTKIWDGMIAFLPEGWKTGDPIKNQTFVFRDAQRTRIQRPVSRALHL
ncbi:MAG: hypothetical protein NZ805_09515 [Armatimonadetes bacterium]|nr:hypothetical protein [Armatimonadota bacterium]